MDVIDVQCTLLILALIIMCISMPAACIFSFIKGVTISTDLFEDALDTIKSSIALYNTDDGTDGPSVATDMFDGRFDTNPLDSGDNPMDSLEKYMQRFNGFNVAPKNMSRSSGRLVDPILSGQTPTQAPEE